MAKIKAKRAEILHRLASSLHCSPPCQDIRVVLVWYKSPTCWINKSTSNWANTRLDTRAKPGDKGILMRPYRLKRQPVDKPVLLSIELAEDIHRWTVISNNALNSVSLKVRISMLKFINRAHTFHVLLSCPTRSKAVHSTRVENKSDYFFLNSGQVIFAVRENCFLEILDFSPVWQSFESSPVRKRATPIFTG